MYPITIEGLERAMRYLSKFARLGAWGLLVFLPLRRRRHLDRFLDGSETRGDLHRAAMRSGFMPSL